MKFVIKCLLILLMHNMCYSQVVLRFQPEIDDKASKLGDVLIITECRGAPCGYPIPKKGYPQGAPLHYPYWENIPLDSHPTPGELITKTKIIDWMTQRIGHFDAKWEGKTQIQVKQSNHVSGKLLVEQAKAALIKQLGSNYLRVEVTPISKIKDSNYNDFKTKINLTYPTAKRVCVWLTRGDKSKIAVWFKVSAYANVLVANRDVRYNTPIQSDVFSLKERNIAGLSAAPVQTLPQPVWLKSSIERNTILLESHLKQPPLVVQGQHINIAVHNHSITVVMDAIALADGYLGETITVKNPLNQKTFVARISGFQQAEITS